MFTKLSLREILEHAPEAPVPDRQHIHELSGFVPSGKETDKFIKKCAHLLLIFGDAGKLFLFEIA